DSVTSKGGVYEITMNVNGQKIPVYFTKDGNYIMQGRGLVPITGNAVDNSQQQTPAEVPKSDKPEVDLFIWSYCPYGVQAQGPLAEVASLLKDSADFNAILYYDGHGAFETQQNKIQACIQKLDKDKYWAYASGFVKDIYPKCSSLKTADCDKTESVKLMKSLGIDSSAVMSCVDSDGESLLTEYSQRASESGVTGSPTLMINGVVTQPSSRTAEAFKTAVCSAFNTEPTECSQDLSSSGSSSTTSAASCS
ncbi:MAG: hypothetical protein AABX71_02320, partial [Nanoarchaeota archaeon]